MKTISLYILLCLSCSAVEAQDWCHQGSVWKYAWTSQGSEGYDIYTYTSDTIILNHLCHKILVKGYWVTFTPFTHDTSYTESIFSYTYGSGDYVYILAPQNQNGWQAIYDFNVQVGDSINIPNAPGLGPDSFIHAVVDTIGTIIIDTFHLKYYTYHSIDSCTLAPVYRNKVIERIGGATSIIPYWRCVTDDTYWTFCSYQDDSFAAYKPNPTCDQLPSGINNIPEALFHIYPNPAMDKVTITIDGIMTGVNLSITDIDGRNILKAQITSPENKISVSDLANGIYLLTISQNGQQAVSRKLVIAR